MLLKRASGEYHQAGGVEGKTEPRVLRIPGLFGWGEDGQTPLNLPC